MNMRMTRGGRTSMRLQGRLESWRWLLFHGGEWNGLGTLGVEARVGEEEVALAIATSL